MYSVLTFKATSVPRLVVGGLLKEAAIERACSLYDSAKILSDHGYLAGGVCVVVVTDISAALAVSSKRIYSVVLDYQCGGY